MGYFQKKLADIAANVQAFWIQNASVLSVDVWVCPKTSVRISKHMHPANEHMGFTD